MHNGVDSKTSIIVQQYQIPAPTSLLVLNCTYSCNVTINFDQAISNYCQTGISVFFTGTSPTSWILNNTNGNIFL